MKNPPAPYKHADKSYAKYSKTGDGSLLAKRQNFAAGGDVYAGWSDGRSYIPNNFVSGSGVDPRTIYSKDYIKSQTDAGWIVDPAFRDPEPAATPAPAAAATPAPEMKLPPAPEFKPQTFTQSVARPAVPTQAEEKVQPYVKSGPVV